MYIKEECPKDDDSSGADIEEATDMLLLHACVIHTTRQSSLLARMLGWLHHACKVHACVILPLVGTAYNLYYTS